MPHGHADLGESTPQSVFYDRGRFGRLFPTLPPFAADTKLIRDALAELGAQGGPMDAGDDLSDPVTLITDPAKSVDNPNNSTITAGFTFLGQFLDHDMTFDPTSSLARRQDPEAIRNFRIPALDLDSVYGGGPVASPHLYDRSVDGGQTTLLTEEIPGSAAVSVDDSDPAGSAPQPPEHRPGRRPAQRREPDRRPAPARVPALPQPGGGGRQDRAGSRLHLAGAVRRGPAGDALALPVARPARVPVRHRWPGDSRRRAHQRPPTLQLAQRPLHPGRVLGGPYRFGHSQVRPSYRANFGTSAADPAQQFFALFLDPGAADPDDPADLRGGRRAPRRFIDWQTFFDFGDSRARPNKKIDTTLSSVLFTLLGQPEGEPISLATRNLLRNLTMKAPSGQRVAQAMNLPELAAGDLDDLQPLHLQQRTPLWFYILREAEVTTAGEQFGPVGGRIVAEVIVGLIKGDRQSYLRQDPDWTPTYGTGGSFTMVELLTTAGVVVTLP